MCEVAGTAALGYPGQAKGPHARDPKSLGQTLRPRCTKLSNFLSRSMAPKTTMGLSNPLFYQGASGPAKGRAAAPPVGPPEPVPTTHTVPCQPPRPTASTVTSKWPPPAVSTSRLPRPPTPEPGHSPRASEPHAPCLEAGQRLWDGWSLGPRALVTELEVELESEARGLCRD